LISFGIVSFFVSDIPTWVVQGATALSILAFGLLVFIIVGAIFPNQIKKVSGLFLSIAPIKIRKALEKFIESLLVGATVLNSPKNLFAVICYTICVWLVTYASYYVFFWLFDIPGTFMQATVVTVFIALAVAAPSAPGFIGVYQIGCVAAFALFSVDIELATAYALISHLVQYGCTVIYGAYALSKTEWSLGDLMKRRS
jgi:glycosyltransferase 2 family protein